MKMNEEQYYEELENLMAKLKEARTNNDTVKITEYIDSLNSLWEKGNDILVKNTPPKL